MIVLDAPAFLNALSLPSGEKATTREVLAELKDRRSRMLAEAAVASRELRVLAPSDESVEKVKKAAGRVLPRLSKADVSVLALARDLGCGIMTDDYAVQVVAARLGIPFSPVFRRGIKEGRGKNKA